MCKYLNNKNSKIYFYYNTYMKYIWSIKYIQLKKYMQFVTNQSKQLNILTFNW